MKSTKKDSQNSQEIKALKAEIKRLRKNLTKLTASLEVMLSRRGFKIFKKEPSEDLLIPSNKYINSFYEKLKKYSFRLFLRDVIKHQKSFSIEKVAKYATKEVTSGYIDFLLKSGIAESVSDNEYQLKKRFVKSFGETLEWFIARLIKKEFGAETVWGVKFRRPKVGGDYDLIAKIDSSILYMEIKSSPPRQIYDKEIPPFFERVEDLSPEISIFFVDTELRMKDKVVPMFESEIKRRYKKPLPVKRIKKELFNINKEIFIINSKNGITGNIATVIGLKWHRDEKHR